VSNKDKPRAFQLQMPPRMLAELDDLARLREQTRAELIRSIIRDYLERKKLNAKEV